MLSKLDDGVDAIDKFIWVEGVGVGLPCCDNICDVDWDGSITNSGIWFFWVCSWLFCVWGKIKGDWWCCALEFGVNAVGGGVRGGWNDGDEECRCETGVCWESGKSPCNGGVSILSNKIIWAFCLVALFKLFLLVFSISIDLCDCEGDVVSAATSSSIFFVIRTLSSCFFWIDVDDVADDSSVLIDWTSGCTFFNIKKLNMLHFTTNMDFHYKITHEYAKNYN